MQIWIQNEEVCHSPFETHFEHLKIEDWNANWDEIVDLVEWSTVAANCNTEAQNEMRDGTVEHFPGRRSCPRRSLPLRPSSATLRPPWRSTRLYRLFKKRMEWNVTFLAFSELLSHGGTHSLVWAKTEHCCTVETRAERGRADKNCTTLRQKSKKDIKI